MFTGIVQALGHVAATEPGAGGMRLSIEAGDALLDDVAIGDSIAVSGVCLTVVARDGPRFSADVSNETLARTTLGWRRVGDGVNLEKSLRLSDRLGGHLVSGHVDGVGEVLAIDDDGGSQRWHFAMPRTLARYVAEKGSIAVDGVSLTVNGVDAGSFRVTLIPHTIAVTTFGERRAGEPVNLEVDLVARYLERLTGAER